MLETLLMELRSCAEVSRIILTLNVPEDLSVTEDRQLVVVRNASPKGFGANHNAAFATCSDAFFCPVNPDIELRGNPFPSLLAALEAVDVGLVAPRVDSPNGVQEDSWRHFPTPLSLIRKAMRRDDGRYELSIDGQPFRLEWVAGMFMLFRSEAFRCLGGFDEGFFLYYEDVDICARMWRKGLGILACPAATVVHNARRDSRRKLRYLQWHLSSMARFFVKHWGRLPKFTSSPQ